ncbi:flavin reductase family protein [Futiania mangrovi]|uniref:Flavin reductase family protein n=1 Tax=Futiania mangrovi TaxID=2959716 RepID=A0A9J6PFL6_9PROT|nr:flavin reductase family protein [Futiania mangrovii]MCP1337513.1 flavin reductase family protein [Futiania mangrovii]
MFYETSQPHGLARNPFKACVVPRPIGWISTVDGAGRVNLAPYSFFNAVADQPPMVMFTSNSKKEVHGPSKDTARNAVETGEFVFNIATWDLRMEMNQSSAPYDYGVSEPSETGLALAPSRLVKPPRIAASPVHFECRTWKTVELPCTSEGHENLMVIGEVIGIHIDDAVIKDGLVDVPSIRPIARLGYMDYAVIDEVFSIQRPKGGGNGA